MSDLLITTDQRRARLGQRHGLAQSADSLVEAVDALIVLHATDPASIFLSAHARVADIDVAGIEGEMYESKSLMRTLAMRRTLFVASQEVLPIIEVSSSGDVARAERNTLLKFLAQSDVAAPETWLADAFGEVMDAMDGAGGKSARQITELVPRLATRITLGSGKYTQETGATSRVLGLMAVEGLLARGRPGTLWTGRQYVWHRRDQWIPATSELPSVEDASVELLRRWLWTFGPGTMVDLRWWTGWTKTKVVKALSRIDAVEVDLEGGPTGYVLAEDTEDVLRPEPWVAVLPALDPTAMGWKEREWYVGDHVAELFDRNGNIGPTIWADGKIIGAWSSRREGGIVSELFESIDTARRNLLDRRLELLQVFLGDVVVKPSFPTPAQKRLFSDG